MRYRVLVIAPRTNLVLVEDEVTAVVNALNANLLQGNVTANQVLDKVAEGWDVIWFMTHGVKDGILLSDGPLLASTLTTFVRTSDARLVVLNTCESIDVALAIHNELLTNLVCTLREVPDREAFFTGKQLAFQLARGKTFSQAYLAAKPGQNQNYLFLVGKDSGTPSSSVLSAVPIMSPMTASAPHDPGIGEQIRKLEEIIKGDTMWGPGLVMTVRTILEEMNQIKRAVLILQIGGILSVAITLVILITVVSLYLAPGV